MSRHGHGIGDQFVGMLMLGFIGLCVLSIVPGWVWALAMTAGAVTFAALAWRYVETRLESRRRPQWLPPAPQWIYRPAAGKAAVHPTAHAHGAKSKVITVSPHQATVTPKPRDVWWASVPFEEGTDAVIRPCVVIQAYKRHSYVLRISLDNRPGYIHIPPDGWSPNHANMNYLQIEPLVKVMNSRFERKLGTCPPATWAKIIKRHPPGQAPSTQAPSTQRNHRPQQPPAPPPWVSDGIPQPLSPRDKGHAKRR